MLRGYRDLKVFQLSYKLAMEIFHLSKAFPRNELYSLSDQIHLAPMAQQKVARGKRLARRPWVTS